MVEDLGVIVTSLEAYGRGFSLHHPSGLLLGFGHNAFTSLLVSTPPPLPLSVPVCMLGFGFCGTDCRLLLHKVSSSSFGEEKKLLGISPIGFPSRNRPLCPITRVES